MDKEKISQSTLEKILNYFLRDTDDGEVFTYRIITLILIFLIGGSIMYKDELIDVWNNSTLTDYKEQVETQKESYFIQSSNEQLHIVHNSVAADFSTVLAFRPRNKNFFVDMITAQGAVPPEVINMKGNPINKASDEYRAHVVGKHYLGKRSAYLPIFKDYGYMYSCPYFDLDNTYSGSVSLFWFDKPTAPPETIEILCRTATRVLGRAR